MTTRVLLVEDEEGLREALAANLELDGFEVAEAATGAQALELLGKGNIDVVLTDVRMPGMSGVELLQVIKQRHPGIPVVLTTAFSLETVLRDAVQRGAFTVLPKPAHVAHVVATLTRAAKRPIVLIVDDRGELVASALENVGIRAKAARDHHAVLALVRAGDVDVCVVDLASSAGILDALRARAPDVTLVAVSGTEHVERAIGAGAFAYLARPLAPADLLQVVAEARRR